MKGQIRFRCVIIHANAASLLRVGERHFSSDKYDRSAKGSGAPKVHRFLVGHGTNG
jgi:hypothetical protein